jgi:hypothetical protein
MNGGNVTRTSAREVRHDQGSRAKSAADLSLRLLIAVLLQYGLGIGYNLYGTAPTANKKVEFFSSPLLALHVILGTLLVITGIILVVLSARTKMRLPVILSSITLACILGAWASGDEFVQKGQTGLSMSMAMLAGGAMLFAAINMWVLSNRVDQRRAGL